MKKSYQYLLVALILTAILIVYHQFGGSGNFEVTYVDEKAYHLVGQHYQGKLDREEWETLFIEMRSLAEMEVVPGILTIIWYNDPVQENGVANVFIGITTSPEISIPEGFVKKEIYMQGVIRTTIKAHPVLMPEPHKVTESMRSYALENGFDLQDILIEKYPEKSLVITEIPVK